MPAHDVSDGFDPDFFDEVLVIRVLDDLTRFGRTNGTPAAPILIEAVVESVSGATTRDQDYSVGEKVMKVTSQYRLRSSSPGYQADVIVMDNAPEGSVAFIDRYASNPSDYDHYVVTDLEDFSRYGEGFVTATVTLTDLQPQPPTE
jgi:hypothetical protein